MYNAANLQSAREPVSSTTVWTYLMLFVEYFGVHLFSFGRHLSTQQTHVLVRVRLHVTQHPVGRATRSVNKYAEGYNYCKFHPVGEIKYAEDKFKQNWCRLPVPGVSAPNQEHNNKKPLCRQLMPFRNPKTICPNSMLYLHTMNLQIEIFLTCS